MNKQLIEALLIERAGYVLRGLKDRVKQVDEQLTIAGHKVTVKVETAAVEPAVETASKPAAKKRTGK